MVFFQVHTVAALVWDEERAASLSGVLPITFDKNDPVRGVPEATAAPEEGGNPLSGCDGCQPLNFKTYLSRALAEDRSKLFEVEVNLPDSCDGLSPIGTGLALVDENAETFPAPALVVTRTQSRSPPVS